MTRLDRARHPAKRSGACESTAYEEPNMTALLLIGGLTVGNFLYQMFMSEPNFFLAFERSYFQAVAIVAYVFMSR